MTRSFHPRMAGARLLHAMHLARTLPGFDPSDNLERATDAAIEHIILRHPRTSTARYWAETTPPAPKGARGKRS